MRWWGGWRHRWTVVLVGRESGNRIPVTFLRFRREAKARQWADRMNGDPRYGSDLTSWQVEPLP